MVFTMREVGRGRAWVRLLTLGGIASLLMVVGALLNPSVGYGMQGSPKVVFVSREFGPNDIFLMNPDGTDRQRLTTSDRCEGDPNWSPDGDKIVYHELVCGQDRETSRIMVVNADGSNKLEIEGTGFLGSPVWSPDGSTIAFRCGLTGLCTKPSDGTGTASNIFDAAGLGKDSLQVTDWSPDGSEILLTLAAPGSISSIWSLNANDFSVEEIVPPITSSNLGVVGYYSPDGTQIVFTRLPEGGSAGPSSPAVPTIVNADGTGAERAIDTGVSPSAATDWGSDNRIYFMSNVSPNNVYSIQVDGTDLKQLTFNSFADGSARLSPPVGVSDPPSVPSVGLFGLVFGALALASGIFRYSMMASHVRRGNKQ